ncbi:hypothetical protein V6N12_044349 [Hibiscus sabdariffa]|uniref:Reverse transcriptase zinc-binding domain-containing protein n=1 Tax=Hibiscus sabdariffa TaxID=183260 RepID=A0ABR2DGZ8_9ROSI
MQWAVEASAIPIGVKPSSPDAPSDSPGWKLEPSSTFTVKSAYNFRSSSLTGGDDSIWRLIQRYKGLQRIKAFLWLLCKGRVLSNDERVRRHIATSPNCVICGATADDSDHILHYCPNAVSIWRSLIPPSVVFLLRLIVLLILWESFMFSWVQVGLLFNSGLSWIMEFGRSMLMGQEIRLMAGLSVGGVIRDSNGLWVVGFSKYFGRCSVIEAEFWAVLEVLQNALRMRAMRIVLESDNSDVVNIL